ncbi:uncharacterized protein VTP21DRAFT_8721 [Calcarisporiella thermophila]|uniref:uncharacterized protein n=1 Tax=Calcarisporiella thermophila TaxID=911321 RepID=UPI003742603F
MKENLENERSLLATPPPKKRRLGTRPFAQSPFKSPISTKEAIDTHTSPTCTPKQHKFASPASRRKFTSPFTPKIKEYSEVDVLRARKQELEKNIEQTKDCIRKAQLAKLYLEKNESETLDGLIDKWRNASREAAELLFTHYRERMIATPFESHEDSDEGGKISHGGAPTLPRMLWSLGIDPKILGYNEEE